MTQQTTYRAWTNHLSTCEDCENGTPEPGDADYVCPEGKRLKALWLGEGEDATSSRPPDPAPPAGTEFQLAVVQMLITFASNAAGDTARLAALARAQVVCGEAARSLITRSEILGKRWDAWTHGELLDLVKRAEAVDTGPGGARDA
jgi:hypothetical protein